MITRVELVAQLQQAGLRSGCHVLVHSSLRSMGPVDGGADTVLDSLLEQLAQDHTQSKYTSSAISVTRLNLGTLRAVILMVRRPSLTL